MIEFTVKPDGGDEYEVTADSRDVYVWERTSRGRTFSQLMNDLHMEDLYRLAHIASRRQGLYSGTLDEFAAACVLDFQETDEVDPTRTARSPERVSRSRSRRA